MLTTRTSLLVTKFCRPVLHTKLVHRPRLFDRLRTGSQRKLTSLVSPAGFGKSALLTEWAAYMTSTGWPVAWLSLDESDNNLAQFWDYLIAALEQVQPDLSSLLAGISRQSFRDADTSFAIALINAISSFPKQFSLVLDNYHTIDSPVVHNDINYLLGYLPTNLHIVISSRNELPLSLARLRAQNDVVDIGVEDLKFSNDEISTYFTQILNLELATYQINRLAHLSEGWISALVLAAPSMQRLGSSAEIDQYIKNFSGNNQYILNFLTSEVLFNLNPQEQEFLLKTSILKELNAPLCNALMGGDDSAEILARLGQSNLFLFPLNTTPRYYRYQNLFADALHLYLQQAYTQQQINQLHLSACQWYRINNNVIQAVPHALAAGEVDLAAQILEDLVSNNSENLTDVLPDWLQQIPGSVLDRHPRLRLQWVVLNIQHGNLKQAETILNEIEQSLTNQPLVSDQALVDSVQKDIAVLRASIQCVVGDFQDSILSAKNLLEAVDITETHRIFLEYYMIWAYHSAGDQTFSVDKIIEGIKAAKEYGLIKSCLFTQGALAFLYEQRGELCLAEQVYRQAMEVISENEINQNILTLIVQIGLSEIHREWNDLTIATDLIKNASEEFFLYKTGEPCWLHSTRTCLLFAKNCISNHKFEDAKEYIDIAKQRAQIYYPINGLMTAVEAVQVSYWLATDDLGLAIVWARNKKMIKIGSGEIYPARRSGEGRSQTERFLIARVALADNHPQECLEWLVELIPELEANNQGNLFIQASILKALAQWKIGRQYEAIQQALHTLAQAEKEGYVRTFVEMHPAMQDLLNAVVESYDQARVHSTVQLPGRKYIQRILSAFQETPSFSSTWKRMVVVDPIFTTLTKRELQVLNLLDRGYSYKTISDSLSISLSTTKTHINNIYSKLGVNKRPQAIARAMDIGLI